MDGRPAWLCAAALAVGVAASVPLRRRAGRGAYTAICLRAVLLLTAVRGAAFATAQAVHTVRMRAHEPRGVPAVVTHCRVTGRLPVEGGGLGARTYGCTYRSSVDGQQFDEERPVDEPYPDGQETRVRLEDGGRMVTGRPSPLGGPFWSASALLALAAAPYFAVRLAGRAREAGL
ncbi:hypothetical protein [Kitasatospora sp. NPDC001095]